MGRREAKRICFLLTWMLCLMFFCGATAEMINPILLFSTEGLSGKLEEETLEFMAPAILLADWMSSASQGGAQNVGSKDLINTEAASEELWNLAAEENARELEAKGNLAAEENAREAEELWNLAVEENARELEAKGNLAAEENALESEIEEVEQPEANIDTPTYEKVQSVNAESFGTFSELVKQFYVIDSTTMADEGLLNAERFLSHDLRISKDVDGPQILIYHTHSQEAFADSEQGNPTQTVAGVGEELARILREDYGYEVLHHEGVYDKPSRNGAYSRALPEVEKLLEENPSLQVVIDLHRDEMPEGVRLVTEIDGKKTARFMFFNGLSRTKKTGLLSYLQNDYLEDNLAFSFQMEKAAQEYFPNLTRRIYLKGYRYNMHIAPKTLLIELGAQNNTLEEAMNACGPLAKLLDVVLSGEER